MTVAEWMWTVVGVLIGLAVIWIALVAVLLVQQRRAGRDVDWRAVLRLVPDVIRLIRRLATDPSVPRGTRWWLYGLLAYLILPIDLIPDFLPGIGYADDAIITVLALRFAAKHAGFEALERNWPGTPDGLSSLVTLARIPRSVRHTGGREETP
ncbi:YkvA family protein [Leifsonia sp. 22587]|uniref:YkvA family protein n=1 Tax=Leifsonia sp. 22587 TaxID=3453946 RepID=UPI003F84A0FD